MHRSMLLGSFVVMMEVASAICAWPWMIGIWSKPNYWFAGFGAFVCLLVLVGWFVLLQNEHEFEKAIEVTTYINRNLTCSEQGELTEPDPRFEQNSGIKRWREGASR